MTPEPVPSPDAATVFSYHDLQAPTLDDVYAARERLDAHLPRTPLVRSPALSEELDADVYLKREDTLPTGAFKVRGGLTLVSQLDDQFRETGLVAASTGNHGLSVAYAGREFDVPVRVVVPEDANPDKVAAMERYGAHVVHYGPDFDAAREHAKALAEDEGYRLVHSGNEPQLVAGVATAGLEVVEDLPDVDTVISPVGGGSSACGYCMTCGGLADARVVGVQATGADAVHNAYHGDGLDPRDDADTSAEGIATRTPFALPVRVLREHLDDMVLVSDDAIETAIRDVLCDDHVLMEGAAAAGVAAARDLDLTGETVVVPVSGRNLDVRRLAGILD
jgi:threonine dehydratase